MSDPTGSRRSETHPPLPVRLKLLLIPQRRARAPLTCLRAIRRGAQSRAPDLRSGREEGALAPAQHNGPRNALVSSLQFSQVGLCARARPRRPGGSGREEGAPDPLDSPEHGAVHSGRRPCESRSMTCKSKRATTGEDRMSGRSPSWRLQPSACVPSLPRSKRAGARPSESHFNPTLSHFIPLSVPLCGPNPTESRRIPPIPASKCSLPRVPG